MDHPDVVLVDAFDRPVGRAPKSSVHHTSTPLHRAFSCHIIDDAGMVVLSRRALAKQTWPGTWTNAFCGHPTVGEERIDALVRHARFELGITLDPARVELVVPDFAYRAVDASEIVEHEICPVFIYRGPVNPRPNPAEVMGLTRTTPEAMDVLVSRAPALLSPWAVLQWAAIRKLAVPELNHATRLEMTAYQMDTASGGTPSPLA